MPGRQVHAVPPSGVSAAGRRSEARSSNEQLASEAVGLYCELNPGARNRDQMIAELVELSRDGLTHHEFYSVFERRMTRAAWNAFLLRGRDEQGEGRIENLADLVRYLTAFRNYSEATGRQVSFSFFATCNRITTAPPLADAILRMDEPTRELFIRELVRSQLDVVASFLSYTGRTVQPRSQMPDGEYEEALENELERLISGASRNRSTQGRIDREHLELFGAVLFQQVNTAAADRDTRRRFDRIDFSRPQVAEMAFRAFVYQYVTGQAFPQPAGSDVVLAPALGVEAAAESAAGADNAADEAAAENAEAVPSLRGRVFSENYDDFVRFTRQFEDMVALVGDNCFVRNQDGQAIRLNDLDPSSDDFSEALRLASSRGANREAVLARLQHCPLLREIRQPAEQSEEHGTPSDVPRLQVTNVDVEDIIAQNGSVEDVDVRLEVDSPETPSVYHLVDVDEAPIDPDAAPNLELPFSGPSAGHRLRLF